MSLLIVSLALSILQASPGSPAPAANDTPPASAQAAVSPPEIDPRDEMVCRREVVVGSNRPQRVCLTVRQRQQIREQARSEVGKIQDRGDENAKPEQGL